MNHPHLTVEANLSYDLAPLTTFEVKAKKTLHSPIIKTTTLSLPPPISTSMEPQTLPENPPPPPPAIDYSSNVDTSRAFRSVKEAVAIFGERFLTGEIFLPPSKPPFTLPKQETPSWKSAHSTQTSWKSCSSSRESEEESPLLLVTSLKKLESELEETKKELKLLKERESETEVVLASINAELQTNRSKIAKAEAAEASEKVVALSSSSSLAPVVSGDGGKKKKVVKKKPIIPLLGDLFSKKKGKSSTSVLNPLYTSSQMHWI